MVWRERGNISHSRKAARCSLRRMSHRKPGKRGSTSLRRAGLSMTNNRRGPQPGSQKAKHGGQAVREKYGPEFYSKIGKKGGETVKEKRGPQFYAEIGKKGGEAALWSCRSCSQAHWRLNACNRLRG